MPSGRHDVRALRFAVVVAALMIAQQVASKSLRDALFLAQFPASDLPKAMIASAIGSVPAVLLTSSGMARYGPGWVAPIALGFSGSLYALEWILLPRFPNPAAALLYLHVAILGSTVISAFWSVINERFDPYTAKRAVGQIAGGAAVGGLIGGVLLNRFALLLEPRWFLLALALASLACALGVALVGANSGAVTQSRHSTSGIEALRNSPYLRLIGSLIALVGLISAFLDYVFKVQASLTLANGPALIGFFATFYMATSVLAAALQTLFARRVLHRLGLARTLALLPAAVLLSGALGAVVQRLWSAALLRGTAMVLESSLFRSGYEPLYTPLTADKKRSSKTIIDVALSRLGDAAGGAMILALLFLVPHVPLTAVVGMAMAGSALALWVANRLHYGYVAELATSLRSNAPSLLDVEPEDASAAAPAISQTQMEVDRERLLSQLAALRSASRSGSTPGAIATSPLAPADPPRLRLEGGVLLAAAHDLSSGDAARARAVLVRLPLDARLAAFAIPLLEHPELALQATTALKSVARETAGQLIDALLDPSLSVVVRRRLPRVLASYAHPRAVRGLVEALREPSLAVRKRAALALAALVQQQPELAPPDQLAFAAVQHELRAAEGALDLQHVFVILSLALDREALELARRALRSQDDRQRGTALEYLESVLPEPLKSELWAHLKGSRRARSSAQRPSEQVLDELKRSSAGRRRKRQPLPESP
jgi:hypothetical protein